MLVPLDLQRGVQRQRGPVVVFGQGSAVELEHLL